LDRLQIPRSSGRGGLILSGLAVCFELDRVMTTSGIGGKADLADAGVDFRK